MLAWDTETDLIKPGLLAPPMACLSLAEYVGENPVGRVVHANDSEQECERILSEPSTAANAPYDLAVVGVRFPRLMPLVFEALAADRIYDVQMRQKLLDIATGKYRRVFRKINGKMRKLQYSLEDLTLRHLDYQLEKNEWRLRYGEFIDVPIEEWPAGALTYARDDAMATLGVHLCQDAEAQEIEQQWGITEVLANEAAQLRGHWALHLAACWGIRTCPYAVHELADRVRQDWEATKDWLIRANLVRPNGSRNTKLAKQRMYQAVMNGAPVKLTDTGFKKVKSKEMTREEAIIAGYISLDEESCEASGDEALVETGRTSSSGPNLQNPYRDPFHAREPGTYNPADYVGYPVLPDQPLGVRDCFVARPGHAYVACDYDKAELHALAQVCQSIFGYSRLGERLRAGFDPHLDMAAQILGISYEEAKARRKAGDREVKQMRQASKCCNFGYPGGLGADSFRDFARKAYGVVMTVEEARWLKQHWFDTWPEMADYFKWINSLSSYDGEATIRHLFSGRWRGKIPYTVCCNTFFQGLTADGAKAALWEITRRQFSVPQSELYGTHIVNFIHDEIIIECPIPHVHEVAQEMQHVMVTEYNKFTPDVPVRATPVAMYRWMKEPDPTYVNGRLVPTRSPHDYLIVEAA